MVHQTPEKICVLADHATISGGLGRGSRMFDSCRSYIVTSESTDETSLKVGPFEFFL